MQPLNISADDNNDESDTLNGQENENILEMKVFSENIVNLIIYINPIIDPPPPPWKKNTARFFEYVVNNIIDKYENKKHLLLPVDTCVKPTMESQFIFNIITFMHDLRWR